jgi:hypothetical protein
MLQPDRHYSLGTYRYGFNGQEKSDEIAGEGNHNTALFWEYDTRTGRRWNLDPEPTIGISEYAVLNNSPLLYSDLLGNTPGGPGDEDNPGPLRKLWNGVVYQANFFTISFKGWNEGLSATGHQVASSSAGILNGGLKVASLGLINRSAESIGINQKYTGWYNGGTQAVDAVSFVESGGGTGTSPSLALSNGEQVVVKKATSVAIQARSTVLANSTHTGTDGNGHSAGSNKTSYTSGQVNELISTEENAQFQVEGIKDVLKSGDPGKVAKIWQRGLITTVYDGKTYILDGHNRFKALSELGRGTPAEARITQLSTEEATKQYKDKMTYIKVGDFNLKISE